MLRRSINITRSAIRALGSGKSADAVRAIPGIARGMALGDSPRKDVLPHAGEPDNPLLRYFDAHREGRGIWKWRHYFEVYHRHFSRFVGTDVHVMEIGIYSGGSLPMWRDYFGPKARIYGVDIEPACEVYREPQIDIIIGDQGDRKFWANVRKSVPRIDILIDDGGHHPADHQSLTLEEMLPHLQPGGVYVCEDLHGYPNYFSAVVGGLMSNLNNGRPSRFETAIHSIHAYPTIIAIEKRSTELALSSEKHGTEWQPFLD